MTDDEHVWACALQVLKTHEERAEVFVAERIGDLALKGDAAGIAMWKAIAARIDELRRPKRAKQ